MKLNIKAFFLIAICTLGLACKDKTDTPDIAMDVPIEVHEIDGITVNDPTTVENLSIFILTGKENIANKSYTTLSEAMREKRVVVNETGSVNKLSIDNNSNDYVFIHSGDIVKGGKQDRTISYDIIIPPNEKNVPLESFCVEQGRWQQRSGEGVAAFSANTKMLSSKELKLAAKHEKNQGRVWSRVSEQQDSLNNKLSTKRGYAVNVSDNESDTSLQLALESEELKKEKEVLNEKLKDLINTPDALGYAYAINGELYGVEVYNNTQLFTDLWDKILESVIVEAISKDGEEVSENRTKKDVVTHMKAIKDTDKKSAKKLNAITSFKTIENDKGDVVFSTEDLEKKKWLHKSYMQIDTTDVVSNTDNLMIRRSSY